MKYKALFIDEDLEAIRGYIKVLDLLGCEVTHCRTTDQALVSAKASPPSVIILDLMMPPGPSYSARQTEEGVRTGVVLYQDLRKLHPHVPVIVLTNLPNPNAWFQRQLGRENLRILRKPDYPPFDFAAVVAEVLGIPLPDDLRAVMRG